MGSDVLQDGGERLRLVTLAADVRTSGVLWEIARDEHLAELADDVDGARRVA
ncbi:hypothetical protein ACFVRU_42390 [Streptomyces sp. NPDC057927]